VNSGENYFRSDFTSIYTMIYNMLNTERKVIVACHEMPFTVITTDNLTNQDGKVLERTRSISGSSLVGSHLNQMNATDKVGTY
jgi:hypothetical protein